MTALEETIRGALAPLPQVLDAYLFGSQARGDARPRSDVDVAVYLDPDYDGASAYGAAADLTTELMAALKRNDVDVVVLNDAPPALYHRVLRDGVRLLSRDLPATTTREGRALSRYLDLKPALDRAQATLLRRIDEGRFGR